MHLVGWEELCKPKKLGGLNIKSAMDMNRAMLAKLAWRVLSCSGQLSVDVLRTKYGYKMGHSAHFKEQHRCFQIWKGVIWGSDLLRKGLK